MNLASVAFDILASCPSLLNADLGVAFLPQVVMGVLWLVSE